MIPLSNEWNLLPFFIAGFAGGLHCLAMCGGFACATCQTDKPLLATLSYNIGRSLTYVLLGGLAGTLGAYFLPFITFYQALDVIRWVIAGSLILIGLYISGLWKGFVPLEQLGLMVWRKSFPLQARIAHYPAQLKWFLSGAVWGGIPCTLVYAALLMSFSTGGTMYGAISMFAFAMGTMPLMLSVGVLSHNVSKSLKSNQFRVFSGGVLILFGLWVGLASVLGYDSLLGIICR